MSQNPAQKSAFDFLRQTLREWGLESLYNKALGFLKQGLGQDQNSLQIELENTAEWKQRFAGNEIRKAHGLAELSPGDYLALERSYRNILTQYGLPSGFYDQHSDFAKMIGNDISPAELDTRAKVAHDQYTNAPTAIKNLWAQYFGTKGDAIAMILDPKLATQVIQDRSNMVAIGGAAAMHGLNVQADRARQLEQAGITGSQADQGYAQIAVELPTDKAMAERFGTQFTQKDAENSLLLNQADATRKRQRLYGQEEGLFNEQSSSDGNSLGVSQSY